ncbi:hypothetical protein [Bacillus stratosphericus]|uniref:hypothetical protein n=1 Tax=Bacillus stratosphericus TaxID=293386 RepID=UPI001CFB64DC|nr:hypothetical protein [Bacillus stratosphericus]
MAALKGVKTIDMKNGEITKVAYDGAEYERVEGEAKVGDLVLITDDSWCDATEGAFYLSIDISAEDPVIVGGIDEKDSNYSDGYALFRKKHTRLKVGDYAKAIGYFSDYRINEGDIVKILEDEPWADFPPFKCEFINKENIEDRLFYEDELVLATEAEVAAAKEAEEKRSIEAKWVEIGRKVGEYKVGDIVKYRSDGEICEVIKVEGYITMMTANHGDCPELAEDIELITPVEARFDRS